MWNPMTMTAKLQTSNNKLTFADMQTILNRPLPPDHTVEQEEDRMVNLIITREYVAPVAEKEMPSDWHSITRSKIELAAMKARLARKKNDEHRSMPLAKEGKRGTVGKHVSNSIDAPIGQGAATSFVFNDQREKFCKRFEEWYRRTLEQRDGGGSMSPVDITAPENNVQGIMEAAAILHGCASKEARETYLYTFGRLDRESLQDDADVLDEALKEQKRLSVEHRRESERRVKRLWQRLVSLQWFRQPWLRCVEWELRRRGGATKSKGLMAQRDAAGSDSRSKLEALAPEIRAEVLKRSARFTAKYILQRHGITCPRRRPRQQGTKEWVPHSNPEFAPIYRSIKDYCEGASPTYSTNCTEPWKSILSSPTQPSLVGIASNEAAWQLRSAERALLVKLSAEEYHQVTAEELALVAPSLNKRLQTMKIFDAKLGEIVKETYKRHRSDDVGGSIFDPQSTSDRSENNPDRRDVS